MTDKPKQDMTKDNMPELKPCPFCGCDQIHQSEHEGWVIPFAKYCRNCRAYGPHKETEEAAAIAWNTYETCHDNCIGKQAALMLLKQDRNDKRDSLIERLEKLTYSFDSREKMREIIKEVYGE